MTRYLGMAAAIAFGLLMAINGAVMLVSPRAWFHMPGWLAGHGSFARKRNGMWALLLPGLTAAFTR